MSISQDAEASRNVMPVRFTGDAKTYFGIWIVNLALTLVTLGIYSAWAKVRNKRYFAQNTLIDGRRFDYHATGKQILIGRLIMLAGIIVLSIPFIGIIAMLALLIFLPALLNRSIAFNARVTSFSGQRFDFQGSYGGAFKAYMLYPALSALTLYTTLPYAIRAQHRYYIENHRFGSSQFSFESGVAPFYIALGIIVGWTAAVSAVMAGLFFAMMPALDQTMMQVVPILMIYAVLLFALLPAGFIYAAMIRNQVFASTTLQGGHGFVSTVSPLGLLGLAVTNALAIGFSLGLALPWARVRMARYMANNTQILVNGSLDSFTGRVGAEGSAVGDAYTDFEGLDLGVAI